MRLQWTLAAASHAGDCQFAIGGASTRQLDWEAWLKGDAAGMGFAKSVGHFGKSVGHFAKSIRHSCKLRTRSISLSRGDESPLIGASIISMVVSFTCQPRKFYLTSQP